MNSKHQRRFQLSQIRNKHVGLKKGLIIDKQVVNQDIGHLIKGDPILQKLMVGELIPHPSSIKDKAIAYNKNWRVYGEKGEYTKVIPKQVFQLDNISQLAEQLMGLINSKQGGALFVGLNTKFQVIGIQLTQNMKSWIKTKLNFVRQHYIYPSSKDTQQDFTIEFVEVREIQIEQNQKYIIKVSSNTRQSSKIYFKIQRVGKEGVYNQIFQTNIKNDVELDNLYVMMHKCSKRQVEERKNVRIMDQKEKPKLQFSSTIQNKKISLNQPLDWKLLFQQENQRTGMSIFGCSTEKKMKGIDIQNTKYTNRIVYKNQYKDLERQLTLIYLLVYGESYKKIKKTRSNKSKIFILQFSSAQKSILAFSYLSMRQCSPKYQWLDK